jgi:MFS family permease
MRRRLLGMLKLAVVDTTALRGSRRFQWMFVGQIAIHMGRQFLVVAVPLQVFEITDSSLMVGLVSFAQTVPLLLTSLFGGAIADIYDRRVVLLVTQLLTACTVAGLAFNMGPDASVWPIFVLMSINAAIMGIEAPTRQSIIPTLVPREQMASAYATSQTLTQTAFMVGPALAGVVIAAVGLGPAYWIAAISTVVAGLVAIPLGALPPETKDTRPGLAAAVEGWRFLRQRPLLQHLMLIDFNAMVFGLPRALFPYIGTVTLGGDAATVGLLNAAPGAGAFGAALTTGWVSMVKRQGRLVVLSVIVWGVAIAGFGLTRSLIPALICWRWPAPPT